MKPNQEKELYEIANKLTIDLAEKCEQEIDKVFFNGNILHEKKIELQMTILFYIATRLFSSGLCFCNKENWNNVLDVSKNNIIDRATKLLTEFDI